MIAINMSDHVSPRNTPLRKELVRCLCQRIFELLQNHPEIMEMPAADCLLQFQEFEFLDLNPTLFEVSRAVRRQLDLGNGNFLNLHDVALQVIDQTNGWHTAHGEPTLIAGGLSAGCSLVLVAAGRLLI